MSNVELKRWAETWECAGRELILIRHRELAHLTDEQAKAAALDLLTMPIAEGLPARCASGLVEQQRLFSKVHSRR